MAALTTPTTLALACHCLHGNDALMQSVIAKELKDNGGVLVEAEALSNDGGPGAHTTTFKVLEVWVGKAGEPGQTITVRHNLNGEACGLKFEVGDRLYLFTSKNGEGMLFTSQCSQRFGEYAVKWGKARLLQLAK